MTKMFMMEFDLVGAEWVVVAYLANDKNMLGVLRSGKDPHLVTGSLISGATEDLVLADLKLVGNLTDPEAIIDKRLPLREQFPDEIDRVFLPRTMSIRQAGKKSNHGLNYGLKYRNFALHNEIAEAEAKLMVEMYTTAAYPGLLEWQEGIRREMKDNDRTLTNCFDRKVRLLGEWGPDLWNQAYSFKPQSTVVDCANEALRRIMYDDTDVFEMVELGSQTHDSVMVQMPLDVRCEVIGKVARRIGLEYMRPILCYSDYEFQLDTEVKVGFNWSDMVEVAWYDDPAEQGEAIKQALSLSAEQPQRQGAPAASSSPSMSLDASPPA